MVLARALQNDDLRSTTGDSAEINSGRLSKPDVQQIRASLASLAVLACVLVVQLLPVHAFRTQSRDPPNLTLLGDDAELRGTQDPAAKRGGFLPSLMEIAVSLVKLTLPAPWKTEEPTMIPKKQHPMSCTPSEAPLRRESSRHQRHRL